MTSWTQFESLYGGFAPRAASSRCRCTATSPTAAASPTSAGSRTPSRQASRHASRCPPPTARSACRSPSRASSPTPTWRSQVSTDDDGDADADGPAVVHDHRSRRWRRLSRPSPAWTSRQGRHQRRDRRERHLHQDQDRAQARRRTSTSPRSSSWSSRACYPLEKAAPVPVPVTGREVRRLGVGAQRHQRPGRRRGRHDGDRPRPGHRRHRRGRHPRPRPLEGRPDVADLALRAERQPDGACSTHLPGCRRSRSRSGAATSRCTTRRTPRCTTRGSRSTNPIGVNGNSEVLIPPSGHVAGVWARTDDTRGVWKAPANDTMRGVLDIERTVTQNEQVAAQPDRHQLHPPVRHPRHPHLGCAHPRLGHRLELHQRPAPVQHGRGDDPHRHPVGGLRAQRRDAVGGREADRRTPSCAACGAPVRCSARPPTRRSTSSATPRPTRRSRSTRACSSSRSASPR